MGVEVNYLAVLLAGLSSMVIGSIWYSPSVFGKMWMEMTGAKMNQKMTTGQNIYMFGGVFVASLVTAYVLAHMTFISNHYFENSYLQDALTTAFWVWLAFTAARIFTHDVFEGRRKKLTLLNVSHELVTLMVITVIIGLMGV